MKIMISESLEDKAKSLAEEYGVKLIAEGEIRVSGKTHTWQEVIDEDLDNILELQRNFQRCDSTICEAIYTKALKKAQAAVVNDWAKQTAREKVGL